MKFTPCGSTLISGSDDKILVLVTTAPLRANGFGWDCALAWCSSTPSATANCCLPSPPHSPYERCATRNTTVPVSLQRCGMVREQSWRLVPYRLSPAPQWDWAKQRQRLRFRTGHQNNIFNSVMLPDSASTIATCAADGQVRVHYIGEAAVESHRVGQHYGRAHKLALSPNAPHCFVSTGEAVLHISIFAATRAQRLPHSPLPTPLLPASPSPRLFSLHLPLFHLSLFHLPLFLFEQARTASYGTTTPERAGSATASSLSSARMSNSRARPGGGGGRTWGR